MTIRITFINGDNIDIDDKTTIYAWQNDSDSSDVFYVKMLFQGSQNDGTEIATSYPEVGLLGLLSTADWFSTEKDEVTKYKTSAILSIKNLNQVIS